MKMVTVILSVLLLIGCKSQEIIPDTKIVYVNKPIPYSPVPPVVPMCTFYVDTLTADDLVDYSKVARAYKLDMTCLRSTDTTLRQIIQKYDEISKHNGETEALIQSFKEQYDTPSSIETINTQPK